MAAGASETAPTQRNRGWIWFFVSLALLTTAAAIIPLWFNLSQQLTREQLDQSRALWKAKAPADYDLEYVQRGAANGVFVVKVRGGRVASVTLDGRPLESRLFASHDMAGLFDDIERFYEQDHQPGSPRSFTKARFDPVDGHLLHYVRSVSSSRQRLEITVRLRPITDSTPSANPS